MTSIYLVGGEDIEFGQIAGGVVNTTAGNFRASYARCALAVPDNSITGPINVGNTCVWRNYVPFSQAEFWFTGRCKQSTALRNGLNCILKFCSADGFPRIQLRSKAYNLWWVETVDGAGATTKIGNAAAFEFSSSSVDKLDVHINYDVVGSIDIYVNGILVYNFAGDCTTDGVTELAFVELGCAAWTGSCYWSEIVVADVDTRSLSLETFPPIANGHANTFDVGSPSVSNINEATLNDTTLNGASTAGLVDQYTNGAVASGTLDVLALIVSARAQRGTAGPTKLALGVRTNGADYWGSDQVQDVAWGNRQEIFLTNPDTGIPWLKSEIGAAVGFNIGSKSAA